MTLALKRTGDEDYPRHLKVLLQGPPKSGKTTFLSTAPNILIAATEPGLASIAHLNIPYVQIEDTDSLQQLEMVLRDDTLRGKAADKLGMPSIDTVAIDTLDAWQDMLKKEILSENRRTALQQADWGTLKERMAAVLKKFVTLPMNVIFTVHTSTTMDDESRMIYAPALQGSIKDEIAGYVDYSLLSFRTQETDKQGISRIAYYLKTEGDQKNPHLGNRAAGRLPTISQPDFGFVHRAAFTAPPVRHMPTEAPPVAVGTPTSAGEQATEQVQTPAQIPSSPPAREIEVPKPSGVPPEDNPDAPINASGISMLTKSYTEFGLVVPETLKHWKRSDGLSVARWFMAWKADKAAGTNPTRDDLIEGLRGYEAFFGELEGVQTGVGNLKPAKSKKTTSEPTPEPAAPAEELPPIDAPKTEEEAKAVQLVQDGLGGKQIGYDVGDNATCEECGEKCDDPDIARLALSKFRKALCVKDYKQAVRDARK